MTFCSFNNDHSNWIADVTLVNKEMKAVQPNIIKNENCTKFVWDTANYNVTGWFHNGYSRFLAVSATHCVTWAETRGELHRW